MRSRHMRSRTTTGGQRVDLFDDAETRWARKIAPYLRPGEPIVAFGITGADPNWRIHGVRDRRGVFEKTIDGVFFPSWPHDLWNRIWHGRTHHAPEGSTAYSYLMSHQHATFKPGKLLPASLMFPTVLTDRRFARYATRGFRDQVSEVAWSCPRQVIARAEVRVRGLSFGRLKLTFLDGSWVLISDMTQFGRATARKFADAINGVRR